MMMAGSSALVQGGGVLETVPGEHPLLSGTAEAFHAFPTTQMSGSTSARKQYPQNTLTRCSGSLQKAHTGQKVVGMAYSGRQYTTTGRWPGGESANSPRRSRPANFIAPERRKRAQLVLGGSFLTRLKTFFYSKSNMVFTPLFPELVNDIASRRP
jgi:hypothetical protein